MVEWYVVDQFGTRIAGPFFDRTQAEMHAQGTNFSVVAVSK